MPVIVSDCMKLGKTKIKLNSRRKGGFRWLNHCAGDQIAQARTFSLRRVRAAVVGFLYRCDVPTPADYDFRRPKF